MTRIEVIYNRLPRDGSDSIQYRIIWLVRYLMFVFTQNKVQPGSLLEKKENKSLFPCTRLQEHTLKIEQPVSVKYHSFQEHTI